MRLVIRGDFGGERAQNLKLVLLFTLLGGDSSGSTVEFLQRTVAMACPEMGRGPAFALFGVAVRRVMLAAKENKICSGVIVRFIQNPLLVN